MARYGHECHAMGLLNTDWGDYGHINHPDFSRIGMIYGAAFSWNADILPEEEINRQISVFEFGDASGKLVSVLDLLCHQDAYPWRTAVMVQEALELHQDKEEAAELLRSCAEGDADAANASIDALCAVLYEKAGTVRPENRPMIYAYLLAADGLKVLNRLLPFLRASLLSEALCRRKKTVLHSPEISSGGCTAIKSCGAPSPRRANCTALPMCSAGMRICCVT